ESQDKQHAAVNFPGVLSLLSSFVHLHQAPFQFSCPAILIFPCHFQKTSFVSEPGTPDKITLPALSCIHPYFTNISKVFTFYINFRLQLRKSSESNCRLCVGLHCPE
uniref:Uncharacterized protein n=1 Tax=Catharus ustulatus TaxID=91951 RepID=A0A8C3VFW2_CATUS